MAESEKREIKVGDRVKIVDGANVNLIGTVEEVWEADKDRLTVKLDKPIQRVSVLSRKTVHRHQLEIQES